MREFGSEMQFTVLKTQLKEIHTRILLMKMLLWSVLCQINIQKAHNPVRMTGLKQAAAWHRIISKIFFSLWKSFSMSWIHNFIIKTQHHISNCIAKSRAYGEAQNQFDNISKVGNGENNHFIESALQKAALAVWRDQGKARQCRGGSTGRLKLPPCQTPENSQLMSTLHQKAVSVDHFDCKYSPRLSF